MRQEANFWNSQSNQFHKWPNIRQTYGRVIDAMPPFPSEQLELDDHISSTTPSVHSSVTQVNHYHQFLIDINAYQIISRMLSSRPNMCQKPRNECWRLSPIYKNCG